MNQSTSTVSGPDRTDSKQRDAAARWRKLLEDQRLSGLPISSFCRERGIPASSLFAWRRKLGAAAFGDGAGDASSANDQTGRFVPVTTADRVRRDRAPEKHAAGGGVSIELSVGLRVVVSPGFDGQLLRDVIDALSAPSRAAT